MSVGRISTKSKTLILKVTLLLPSIGNFWKENEGKGKGERGKGKKGRQRGSQMSVMGTGEERGRRKEKEGKREEEGKGEEEGKRKLYGSRDIDRGQRGESLQGR